MRIQPEKSSDYEGEKPKTQVNKGAAKPALEAKFGPKWSFVISSNSFINRLMREDRVFYYALCVPSPR